MKTKLLIDAGRGDDECDGLLASLGDWFWESVFKKISFSERARAELVCRKWYGMLRLRFFWVSVGPTDEEKMTGKWDAGVLRQLVANSLGPRSLVNSEMPISPIHEIDMTGCHLRGISPLKLLEMVECCPNLEAMKLSGLVSSLTGTDLYFHIKDFLYITDVVCLSAGRLKCLEIDVRVESTWSMYDQAKCIDPNSWDQLLEWLVWGDLVVDVKRLEVINMPHYAWEDIEGIGVFLIDEPSVAEESLEILVEVLGINESVNCVVFKLEDEELGGKNSTVYLRRAEGALCIDQLLSAEAAKEAAAGVHVERLGNDVEVEEVSTTPTFLSTLKKLGLKTIRSNPPSN